MHKQKTVIVCLMVFFAALSGSFARGQTSTLALDSFVWSQPNQQGVQVGIAGPSVVGMTPRPGKEFASGSTGWADEDKFSVALRASGLLTLCVLPPTIDLRLFNGANQRLRTASGGSQYSHPGIYSFDISHGAVYQRLVALHVVEPGATAGQYRVVAHVTAHFCAPGANAGSPEVELDSVPFTMTLHG
jgi:hypothetical protein